MEDNVMSDGDEDYNGSDSDEEQFDITLAASHSYMGNGLVAVGGRSVLEAGWRGRVPTAAHHGAVFPGETVPMLLTHPHDAAVITHAIKEDKLFGLLCPDETGTLVSGYGVLCEVFEVDTGAGHEAPRTLSFKARATHRFRCMHMPKNSMPIYLYSRMRVLEVCVLPEVRLGEPLRNARLASLDGLRRNRTSDRLRCMDAAVTPWPRFVYDIFDYRRMRQIIQDYFKTMSMDNVPEEAVSLSFWTASNLALSARDRLALFVVDDALLRLHMEVRLITRKSVLCCAGCAAVIARREHILAMSSEGVHSNYTNLGGYMHDIVTVSRASNTAPSGGPSTEFSWFPGYAWTIMQCASCMAHVGWRFDARRRTLRPLQFYGLCRNFVQPRCDGDASPRDSPPPADSTPPPSLGAAARALSAELRAAQHALDALVHPHLARHRAPTPAPEDASDTDPDDEMNHEPFIEDASGLAFEDAFGPVMEDASGPAFDDGPELVNDDASGPAPDAPDPIFGPDAPALSPTRDAFVLEPPTPTPNHVSSIPDAPFPSPTGDASIPEVPAPTPNRAASIPDAPFPSPIGDASMPEAPALTPNRIASIPDAPFPSPTGDASIPEAPALTPIRVASIPDAPFPSTNGDASIPEAPAPTLNRVASIPDAPVPCPIGDASILEAPALTPNRVASISDAPFPSPTGDTDIPEAPAQTPNRVASIPDAPFPSPTDDASVPEAPAKSPVRDSSVPEASAPSSIRDSSALDVTHT